MSESLIRWTSGLSIIAAAWLVFSPLWIHYTSNGNVWTQVIIGIIVGALAIVKLSAPTTMWSSGLNFLVGIWFIVAPWVLVSTTAVKWNQMVLGAIVAGLAALEMSATSEEATPEAAMSARESVMTFGERIPGAGDRKDDRR